MKIQHTTILARNRTIAASVILVSDPYNSVKMVAIRSEYNRRWMPCKKEDEWNVRSVAGSHLFNCLTWYVFRRGTNFPVYPYTFIWSGCQLIHNHDTKDTDIAITHVGRSRCPLVSTFDETTIGIDIERPIRMNVMVSFVHVNAATDKTRVDMWRAQYKMPCI